MIAGLLTTNSTEFKNSFRDQMLAAGKINTILYDSSFNLVFTLVGFSGVFKLADGDWFKGDAWTSGVTITSPTTLHAPYNSITSGQEAVLVMGPDYFCISLNNLSPAYIAALIFTKDVSGKELFLGFSQQNSSAYSNVYNYDLVTREELHPALRPTGAMTDDSGFLFSTELLLKNSGNFLRVASMPNVKILMKTPDTTTHTVYGNDVSVPGTYSSDGATILNANILLIGGNL